MAIFALASALLATSSLVGTKFPSDITLDHDWPPQAINLSERMAGKKIILIGLPGAFTPTWSTRQIPGYLEAEAELKEIGIDEVIVYCVNDMAVMGAWAENQGVKEGGLMTMMGDPDAEVTTALAKALTHPGPMRKFGQPRSKRFALYVVDGVVKIERTAEGGPMGEEDPAGDDFPEETLAPAMIKAIKSLGAKDEM